MSNLRGTSVDFYMSGNSVYYRKQTNGDYTFYKGDRYYHLDEGYVYECTAQKTVIHGGYNSYVQTTDWKYVQTDIIKKPTAAVTNLTLKRNSGYNFTISWNNSGSLTDSTSNSRATGFRIFITLGMIDGTNREKYYYTNGLVTSFSKTVFATSAATTDYAWERGGFAPYAKEVKFINFKVVALNNIGEATSSRHVTYYFEYPSAPVIGTNEYKVDEDSGTVSVDFKSPLDTSSEKDKVMNNTVVVVYDSRTGKTTTTSYSNTTEGSGTVSQEVPDRQTMTYGDYVNMTFTIKARGIRGDSSNSVFVSEAFPQKPIISVGSVSQDWVSGSAIISIITKPNAQTNSYTYGVTNVKLQVLRSVDYDSADKIPIGAQWKDVGPVEDKECNAISLGIPDIVPDAGKYTWVRAKSWCDFESLFYRYSDPIRIADLETPAPVVPSAGDDFAEIISYSVNADGESVELLVAWDADGEDDSNNTEVSWSTSEKAWRSTKQPDTFMFGDEWDEGAVTVGSKTYGSSAHITVSELERNTKYYMTCRRVLDPTEGDTSYGPYSTKRIVNTNDVSDVPQSVAAYVSGNLIEGEPLRVSWDYGSQMEQSSWMIKKAVGSSYGDEDIILASGNDQRHAYNVSYYRGTDRRYPIASEDDKSIGVYVVVIVGSVTLTSEISTVRVLRRPLFDIATPSSTILQPATMTVFSDTRQATASLFVTAGGVVGSGPSGETVQTDGDTVWSGTVEPQWELVSQYASDTDVEQAKQALDAAQEAYDAVVAQYQEAMSKRDDALSRIDILSARISNAERDIPTAQATLEDAQDRLDGTDEDDPMYNVYLAQRNDAQSALDALQSGLADDRVALADAEEELSESYNEYDRMLAEVTAKGHAEQVATTGKNLLSPMSRTTGIVTLYEDGRIVINGTLSESDTTSIKPFSI